jgi:hypothetical protein
MVGSLATSSYAGLSRSTLRVTSLEQKMLSSLRKSQKSSGLCGRSRGQRQNIGQKILLVPFLKILGALCQEPDTGMHITISHDLAQSRAQCLPQNGFQVMLVGLFAVALHATDWPLRPPVGLFRTQ